MMTLGQRRCQYPQDHLLPTRARHPPFLLNPGEFNPLQSGAGEGTGSPWERRVE